MTPATPTITRAAFAVWQDRIAPVFDVSRHLLVVDVAGGKVVAETIAEFEGETPAGRALRLAELGVAVLVCGAISQPVEAAVTAQQIAIVPFVTGPVDEVVQAWLRGRLARDRYEMPGCCRRVRRRGPGGRCVCPRCGHAEPHTQGEPCAQKHCPQCGTALRRG